MRHALWHPLPRRYALTRRHGVLRVRAAAFGPFLDGLDHDSFVLVESEALRLQKVPIVPASHQVHRYRLTIHAVVDTYRHGSRCAAKNQGRIDDGMEDAERVAAGRNLEQVCSATASVATGRSSTRT